MNHSEHLNWYQDEKTPPVPSEVCRKCKYSIGGCTHGDTYFRMCNYVVITGELKKMPSVDVDDAGNRTCKYFTAKRGERYKQIPMPIVGKNSHRHKGGVRLDREPD